MIKIFPMWDIKTLLKVEVVKQSELNTLLLLNSTAVFAFVIKTVFNDYLSSRVAWGWACFHKWSLTYFPFLVFEYIFS